MELRSHARGLINLAREITPVEIIIDRPLNTDDEIEFLHEKYDLSNPLIHYAKQLVRQLDGALAEAGWKPDMPTPELFSDERWVFGTAVTLKGRQREIYRGFLEPVRSIPILNQVPDRVALYLITVEEGEDYLIRENHSHIGWHYHYLDQDKRRSNVVLCWDTRWKEPVPQSKLPKLRGLFVEKHAEKGKSFTARPDEWGERKRETMYAACREDLLSRKKIEEYRCAANKSEPVYPPGAMLTPHPSSIAGGMTNSGGKPRKRRR